MSLREGVGSVPCVSKCPESLTARRQLLPFCLLFLWNVKKYVLIHRRR